MEYLRFAVIFFAVHSCVAIYVLKALLAPSRYDRCSPTLAEDITTYMKLLIIAVVMKIAACIYQQSKTIMELLTIPPVSRAVEPLFTFTANLFMLYVNIAILALYGMDACKWLALTYICYLPMLTVFASTTVFANVFVVPFEPAKKKD